VTQPDIAIVGGGLLGRLLAWRASTGGLRVALYDAATQEGEDSAAWAAAGMITPAAEAVDADPEIVAMGRRSLRLWPRWLAELPEPVFYRDDGTLLLWHREDAGEARRFESSLQGATRRRIWFTWIRLGSHNWNRHSIQGLSSPCIFPARHRLTIGPC
jgi:glycine oxidase